MRKTFSLYRVALSVVCAFMLLGSVAYAQKRVSAPVHHNGLVQDWSKHHVVYARFGLYKSIIAAQRDPRATDAWLLLLLKEWNLGKFGGRRKPVAPSLHRDWSISLGTGDVASTMFPAKFGFFPDATPDCTSDFVVFPVNVTGSSSQPNIVAFNNLYSGTAGGTGICNAGQIPSRLPSGTDDGVSATTLWSYNIQGIAGGGSVTTSPTLSLDGTRVAFVESKTGNAAHFHVLAWKADDGQDSTNLQNVLLPKPITTFSSTAPAADSGTASDLVVGSDPDTLSSPFIDYANDFAYVGNDTGTLFRVKNVFCAGSSCTGAGSPAPSLDTNWGSGGALSVCASAVLTAPVIDGVTGNIFVGCSDGKLYGFTSAGAALANSPVTVGNGGGTGGIVDSPLIDAVNGFVYVTAGNSGAGRAVIVQAKTTDLSAARTATLGPGGLFNMHSPAFNDAYFNSATPASWLLYDFGTDNSGACTDPSGKCSAIYGVGFDASHNMTTGAAANETVFGTAALEFSPETEFMNGATDQLFTSALAEIGNNFAAINIGAFINTTNALDFNEFSVTDGNPVTPHPANGTSGIIIDNASTAAQASSLYFGALAVHTAVKLTQAGLN